MYTIILLFHYLTKNRSVQNLSIFTSQYQVIRHHVLISYVFAELGIGLEWKYLARPLQSPQVRRQICYM
jgi:hypothetical protein